MSSLSARIAEKRQELESLSEIKYNTALLAEQLKSIEEKLDSMADGAESVALILSNWQNVINSISLASLALRKYGKKDFEDKEPLPECLVRINMNQDPAAED